MSDATLQATVTAPSLAQLSACAPLAPALGIVVAVALNLALTAYARRAYGRWRQVSPPVNPTPEAVH